MKNEKYWDDLVNKANETRKLLNEKPDKYKIGHWNEPGSILNAYREGDLTFDEAYFELVTLINNPEFSIDIPVRPDTIRFGSVIQSRFNHQHYMVISINNDNTVDVQWLTDKTIQYNNPLMDFDFVIRY